MSSVLHGCFPDCKLLATVLTVQPGCQWLLFFPTCLLHLRRRLTFSSGKCNTDHRGGQAKQDRNCAPVRNPELFSFSYFGTHQQPKYALANAQTQHFPSPTTYVHTCTHTRTPLHPFPHILRGEVRLSAVWSSRPVFPLAWHSAHINSPPLQKPLMQGRVLTVF